MSMTKEALESPIMRHFVLREARVKQVAALDYIERKFNDGFLNIVIAAPTGVGKSAIGATCAFWSQNLKVPGVSGAYYLVTQKMLQDQLKNDIANYIMPDAYRRCRSIKSASEYKCLNHGTCAFGLGRKAKCECLRLGTCSYMLERNAWGMATMAVTNYPYLMTEHQMVGKLLPRKVLVLDECHSLEKQILRFVEVSITQEGLLKWAPTIKRVPAFDDVLDFADFLLEDYLPIIQARFESFEGWESTDDSPANKAIQQEIVDLESHIKRVQQGATLIADDPDNWVFYQEYNKRKELEAMAKPLNAAPFSQDLVLNMGHVRIFMSAYPGSKQVFCRSLGLDPKEVAWLNLNSTFPIENRPILMTTIGSMSQRNREDTLPAFLRFSTKILDRHKDTKGIIHCNSYELGKAIFNALSFTEHSSRLLFPQSADERDPTFQKHRQSKEPTIIISPSMTEGFDFAEDLARWQIIAKVPYPYLGDRQVEAKKELDPAWYDLQAVESIIQACGRIVRSDRDKGETYILDSDFLQLFERCEDMFPRWWTDALVWPKRKGSR